MSDTETTEPQFPLDEGTLRRLVESTRIDPKDGRSHLFGFLRTVSRERGLPPGTEWSVHEVVTDLVGEVRRLRTALSQQAEDHP